MEKIIYIYKKKQMLPWWKKYWISQKEIKFLNYPVQAYEVRISKPENLFYAMKKVNKLLQKKEMIEVTSVSQKTFLFYSWEDCDYPAELMEAYYREQYEENPAIMRAEHLLVLDSGMESGVELVSSIYQTYNYVTIVTDCPNKWDMLMEEAYEEYGLSIRCVSDGKDLSFYDKTTLIVDLRKTLIGCWRQFPKESIYMDFCESPEKRRWIFVKCGKFPYISLRNTLDTILRDGV